MDFLVIKAYYPKLLNLIDLDRSGTFIMIVIALVAIMIITYNLINSYTGRAFLTMRGSESWLLQGWARTYRAYRLLSFAITVAYAGLGRVYICTLSHGV